MKKTLVVAMIWAVTSAVGLSAATAAGTSNGNAGCVAQVNTTQGAPGQSIEAIKRYMSPVPGALISAIAHQDRAHCELPE